MKINWISEFRKLWGSVTKENNHFTTERIEGLIVSIIADSRQQGRMEMAEEILKTKFELNVDGNLFEVINPDIVSKMVTPPTINK